MFLCCFVFFLLINLEFAADGVVASEVFELFGFGF